jgi:hypothetical protein
LLEIIDVLVPRIYGSTGKEALANQLSMGTSMFLSREITPRALMALRPSECKLEELEENTSFDTRL